MIDPAELLPHVGLSEKETKIYLALLELGLSKPSHIAKQAGIKRPTTYVLLEGLIQRGFVSVVSGKQKVYKAEDPNKLLLRFRELAAEFERSLPLLTSLMNTGTQKPTVRFFSGMKEIQAAYEESLLLPPNSELLAMGSVEGLIRLFQGFIRSYLQRRSERKIFVRAMAPADRGGIAMAARDKMEYRESRLLEPGLFTRQIEINIYGNKVLVVSFEWPELIAILIESTTFAEAFRQIFEILWQTVAVPLKGSRYEKITPLRYDQL